MVAQKGDTGRHNNDHGTEMASQTAGTTRTQWRWQWSARCWFGIGWCAQYTFGCEITIDGTAGEIRLRDTMR